MNIDKSVITVDKYKWQDEDECYKVTSWHAEYIEALTGDRDLTKDDLHDLKCLGFDVVIIEVVK